MLRACSSRSRKPTITNLPAVQTRGGDFSAIRVRKNTTSCLIAWTGYGWLITIRQATGRSSVLFSPIPSRPSPCLLTNRPNMFCPGRQGQRILFVTSFSDANVSQILRHFHLCLTDKNVFQVLIIFNRCLPDRHRSLRFRIGGFPSRVSGGRRPELRPR